MKQIFIIGASSKVAVNLEKIMDDKKYTKLFFGRNNPDGLKNFQKYEGIYDQKSVDNLLKTLNAAITEKQNNFDEMHLIILAGISSKNWLESFYINEYMPAVLSEEFANIATRIDKKASITLVGSAASYMGAKIQYATTKASLIGVLHTINRDFSKKVRINLIVPSAFESGMTSDWNTDKKQAIGNSNSIGRLGSSLEIAESIKFAIDNNFLTNAVINMTGGLVNIG